VGPHHDSQWQYGQFGYAFNCGLPYSEEPEGLDYVDLTARLGVIPGQLHAIVYSNGNAAGLGNPNGWLKNYSTQ
jgi:hypothetical protein